jgi:glycosyltransferase involved in cell wall biosynthesis
MNVLFVAHAYPRWDSDIAGVFVERLAVALTARTHSVEVIAPADQGKAGHEHRRGIPVFRVRYAPKSRENLAYSGSMVQRGRGLVGTLTVAGLVGAHAHEISRRRRTAGVDIVHAHWWVPAGLATWMARLAPSCPYIVTLHGTDVALFKNSWMARFLAKRVLRGAAAVTAVSSYLAREVERQIGFDSEQIVVQPMPVDVARFNRTSQGGGGVVAVGRLTKQKNIDMVLEAVAQLGRTGRDVTLTVVGDGPERASLERRARELELIQQTRFLGAVTPEQVPEALGNADTLVFPASNEGFGLVAAEALMLGIPVVASQGGGGVTDIVPALGGGRLVSASHPEALASAIRELLDDPKSRELAVETGRRLKRRLAPDAVAQAFESVYQEALARH